MEFFDELWFFDIPEFGGVSCFETEGEVVGAGGAIGEEEFSFIEEVLELRHFYFLSELWCYSAGLSARSSGGFSAPFLELRE